MSADNGIYILQNRSRIGLDTEYRVAHCMAIDNIYDPELGEFYLVTNFGRSVVFPDARSAQAEAEKLYSEWAANSPVEYGIVVLDQFTNLKFPRITIAEAEEKIRTIFMTPLPKPTSNTLDLKGAPAPTIEAVDTFQQFWMVFVEGGGNSTVKHHTKEEAEKEAARLVIKNKRPAYVLETVQGFRLVDQVVRMVPTR